MGVMTPPQNTPMSDEHKAALAVGRAEGKAVRAYLEALEQHRPKRGRKRTPESIGKRLEKISVEIEEADPLKRLQLIQERIDLGVELEKMETIVDITALETEFVRVAADYASRKGISSQAFKELGVPTPIIKRAGIRKS